MVADGIGVPADEAEGRVGVCCDADGYGGCVGGIEDVLDQDLRRVTMLMPCSRCNIIAANAHLKVRVRLRRIMNNQRMFRKTAPISP